MSEAESIEQWLSAQGLGQYAENFKANDIDIRALPYLSDADLKDLGVSLGHRRILLAAIRAAWLQGNSDTFQNRCRPTSLSISPRTPTTHRIVL